MSVEECLVGAYRIPKERLRDHNTSSNESDTDYHWILVSDSALDQTHEFDALLLPAPPPPIPGANRNSNNGVTSVSTSIDTTTATGARNLGRLLPGNVINGSSRIRSITTPPRLIPERIQTYNPHIRCTQYVPPSSHTRVPPPTAVTTLPVWLQELLAFRRKPSNDLTQSHQSKLKEQLAQIRIADKAKLKRSQDLLTLTLLRAIYFLRAKGEIRGKLLLSRQSPNNELKQLVLSATTLAQETFEMLPPYLASISPENFQDPLKTRASSDGCPTKRSPPTSSGSSQAGNHSLPHSTVALNIRSDGMSNMVKTLKEIGAYSLPASNEMTDEFQLVDQDLLLESTVPSAPPHGAGMMMGKTDRAMVAAASIMHNHQLAYGININGFDHALHSHVLAHRSTAMGVDGTGTALYRTSTSNSPPGDHPSAAPAGVFCPPLGSTPYGLPFSGVFGSSAGDGSQSVGLAGRRQSSNKTLFDGDRPLTPPAQGWYAKYSSGVTGVVWDRVHQAWVVSWTLAGKRTFRHFTCKSFGGFDKAREAAIEFRLARNRDIAAYNKRCKDRR